MDSILFESYFKLSQVYLDTFLKKEKQVTRNFAIKNKYWIKSIALGESIYQGRVVMET